MQQQSPFVSVIILTHNRRNILLRVLEALCLQTFPAERMEVIVVANGCNDGTQAMLAEYASCSPFSLVSVEISQSSPGAARNQGAEMARGRLLIFLDDDIQVSPQLVEAHVNAQQEGGERAVVGYLAPVLLTQSGLFKSELRIWWEAMYTLMQRDGYRFSYTDLLSGNFSIRADLFNRLGGFNPDLIVHEDYEFGYRLIQAEASIVYAEQARGEHLITTSLAESLRRKYLEGVADVRIGRLYPRLRPHLFISRLMRFSRMPSIFLRTLAFRWPWLGARIVAVLHLALVLCDRMKLRSFWLRLLYGMMNYHYWRGVSQELKSLAELKSFLGYTQEAGAADETEVEIDLEAGLRAAEHKLDEAHPTSVRIYYQGRMVGRLPPQPGSERLRGVHLAPILTTDLLAPLLRTLAAAGAVQDWELSHKIMREMSRKRYGI